MKWRYRADHSVRTRSDEPLPRLLCLMVGLDFALRFSMLHQTDTFCGILWFLKCSRTWDRSIMWAKRWLCNSPSPPRRDTDRIPGVNYRCVGFAAVLPSQRAAFQPRFSPCTLDPFTHLLAAPPQLIDNLPWWVETPCHQLLSHWKSIKNKTHLHPWAWGSFVLPIWQWRVLFFSKKKMPRNSGEKKVWGVKGSKS